MWIANADIARVMEAKAKPRPWDKWYVRPFIAPLIWLLTRKRLVPTIPDSETRAKLSLFLRSRWFRPPFDGRGFCNILLDGLSAMGEPRFRTASLMPAGHRLDLLVTATDFHGTERSIYLHSPPIIREREHRHIFRFSFEKFKGGAIQTDFDSYNIPSLAFAARATASFPGAFPPVRIDEMDAALMARHQSWPAREQFLRDNFSHYHAFGVSPERAVLVDGSVLNNKPVLEAIEAASSHAAFREVDRRLIYIDPHPGKAREPTPGILPGFIRTITGALSELPRYEPIFGELSYIEVFNANVSRLQETIDSVTPRVKKVVEEIVGGRFDQLADAKRVYKWRLQVAQNASTKENILYTNYIQLLLGSGLEYLAQLVCAICTFPQGSPKAHWIVKVLRLWAEQARIYDDEYAIPPEVNDDVNLPDFARFLGSFDLNSRRRRIQFIMRAIDGLHSRIHGSADEASRSSLDDMKRRFFRLLDALRQYRSNDFLRAQTISHVRALFSRVGTLSNADDLPDANTFVQTNFREISALIEQIGTECNFNRFSSEMDETIGSAEFQALDVSFRREIIEAYLGFDLWDAASFPMISMKSEHEALQLTELQKIAVDRISPDDVTAFADRGPVLKGGEFGGFAGFFSHAARENDYLWGRLHAIDRLLDIVESSVAQELTCDLDMGSFRKRAIQLVLRTEAKRLPNMGDLIADLQATYTA